MQRFNAYLRGWLGLLDAKIDGRSPTEFEDALRGVLDAFPFVHAARREVQQGGATITPAVPGFYTDTTANLTPGPGEILLVDRMTVFSETPLAAATGLIISPGFTARTTPLGLFTRLLHSGFANRFTVGQCPYAVSTVPFVLVPGDIAGVWAAEATLPANYDLILSTSFVRCQI